MKIPKLKKRATDSHKGTYGRALIIAGSRGMTGAASLAGYAAIKSGAGLVTVAVPNRCLETVAAFHPCYMTVPLADDQYGKISTAAKSQIIELVANATSIGIGPGLSRSPDITVIVDSVYRNYTGPMVVDADALNALASSDLRDISNHDTSSRLPNAEGPRILTPHIGEFRRLIDDSSISADDCRDRAKEFADKHGVILVLKGHKTLVTDGSNHFENAVGNPGMATGGSGDVLTGTITALLGQGYKPIKAAVLGVHVHGLAGDLAVEAIGSELSIDAVDIANALGSAFARLTKRH